MRSVAFWSRTRHSLYEHTAPAFVGGGRKGADSCLLFFRCGPLITFLAVVRRARFAFVRHLGIFCCVNRSAGVIALAITSDSVSLSPESDRYEKGFTRLESSGSGDRTVLISGPLRVGYHYIYEWVSLQ